uniref:cysteine--tRNA ligase n=1 Tax=Aureoumbra lagunensis TaxID=44058 RepID=A0A7S3NK95_9STRA|mmetsp:Transcript_1976/g.3008  ORF Transcript_1976/g.3008 Transcript_1976/m.3008 type:complete len:665 (+) Transcript_1976:35-2029(+)
MRLGTKGALGLLLSGFRSTHQFCIWHPKNKIISAKKSVARSIEDSIVFELRDAATTNGVRIDEKQNQKWYACGPTVYDAAHVGHARTYVTLDILRRVASRWGGIEIEFAMGVTDIDDKIINRANELEIDFQELARREEIEFFADMEALGCLPPDRLLRVSEHVHDIVSYIQDIIDQGYGYETSDGVWFNVAKLDNLYGVFAEARGTSQAAAEKAQIPNLDSSESETIPEKKDIRDFALWKLAKSANEPGWDSPWGRGRPGWHIECSAMTRATFGDLLDLHAGGVDLAFPHHENEIAQWRGSRGGDPSEWCNCWIHTGHLHIEGRKMSKSLKNFITVKQLLNTPESHPEDFRMLCSIHRYRSTLSFADDALLVARRLRLELETALLAAHDTLYAQKDYSSNKTKKKSALRMKPDRKRFTMTETQLADATAQARSSVTSALLKDLDVPIAMTALAKLATRIRQYALNDEWVYEPLYAAANFLAETLRDLGFTSTASAWYGRETSTGDGEENSSLNALNTLVDFRASVRTAALSGDIDSLKRTVLTLCDDVRTAPILKQHRVAIVDRPDGSSALTRALDEENEPSDTEIRKPRRSDKKIDVSMLDIPPSELFKQAEEFIGKFSEFDDEGLPTHDAEGIALSKSMRKKLKKRLDIHSAKWTERQSSIV